MLIQAPLIVLVKRSHSHLNQNPGREFLLDFQFKPACIQKPGASLPSLTWFLTRPTNPNCQCKLWILGFCFKDQILLLPLQILEGKPLLEAVYLCWTFDHGDLNLAREQSPGRSSQSCIWRRAPEKGREHLETQPKTKQTSWGSQNIRTQELFRKMQSILNKLTPQMFNQLIK